MEACGYIYLIGGGELFRVNEEERKRKIEEQIGKTYGYYTILSFAEFRKHEMFFNCRCVCGTEKVVKLTYLKTGHTVSCGCMRGKHLPKAEKDDLTGMKFGLWNVLHRDTEATTVAPRYICQCECGTIKSVVKYALKNGTSWHCGCQKELVQKQAAEKYSKKFRAGEYEQKPVDLIGRRYGKLQVLSKIGDGAASRSSYVCKCDCGNKVVVRYQNLANQKGRRSCGCAEFTDLTGKRFSKLVVEERVTAAEAGKEGNRHLWRCKCDCGKTTFVEGGNLLNGTTKSCGCLREGPREDLTGRRFGRLVVKGWLPDENRGIVWECQCDCGGTFYTKRSFLLNGSSISCGCFMRQLAPKVVQYARVNSGVIEDTNVKLIQGALEGKLFKSNTSGVRGVSQDKKTGYWIASISFKKNKIYLGMFKNIEDAAKVRKKAENVLFGEFLEYYESELKENHEAEVEELKQKYLKEIREYAAQLKHSEAETSE